MRIVFFGSSEFSLAALTAISDSSYDLAQIITTPDKQKGRGLKTQPTPVKLFCKERNLPCVSPETLKNEALLQMIHNLQPEVFVISSYGKLVPKSWLEVPSKARLNIHPSLLPKFRGAAPINWSILEGESETGLSIADITSELDAGDVYYQEKLNMAPNINAEELSLVLSQLSGKAILEVLTRVDTQTLVGTPQDHMASTYARKLSKNDGLFTYNEPAMAIHNKVRGLLPWPTAYFMVENQCVQILESVVSEPSETESSLPGTLMSVEKTGAIGVQTGKGILEILRVKPSGKKDMNASDYVNGRRLKVGMKVT